jgi:excisionase family DNA binding protein
MAKQWFMTVQEAADYLQVHERTVRKMVAESRLSAYKIDTRKYMLKRSDLNRYKKTRAYKYGQEVREHMMCDKGV